MTLVTGLLDLPPQPHFPGQTARPDVHVFAAIKARLQGCETPEELQQSDAFAAGFEAFRAGYFWEAHECWEAVWLRLPPASRERHMLRGLIQLANAGLKRRMQQSTASDKILRRADSALAEAFRNRSAPVMGVSGALCDRLRMNINAL